MLMSTTQAAQHVGVHGAAIRRFCDAGLLPHIKRGNARLIDVEMFEAWAESHADRLARHASLRGAKRETWGTGPIRCGQCGEMRAHSEYRWRDGERGACLFCEINSRRESL